MNKEKDAKKTKILPKVIEKPKKKKVIIVFVDTVDPYDGTVGLELPDHGVTVAKGVPQEVTEKQAIAFEALKEYKFERR